MTAPRNASSKCIETKFSSLLSSRRIISNRFSMSGESSLHAPRRRRGPGDDSATRTVFPAKYNSPRFWPLLRAAVVRKHHWTLDGCSRWSGSNRSRTDVYSLLSMNSLLRPSHESPLLATLPNCSARRQFTAVSFDKAIGFESTPIPTAWTQRDILLYTVGIGGKSNELQWVNELTPGWHAFPTYPLVLPFKGDVSHILSTGMEIDVVMCRNLPSSISH